MERQSLFYAFKNAWSGIFFCLKTERNIKIHILATFVVSILAWYFNLDKYEILVLVFTVMIVLVAEMLNTVIETVVDLISPEYHPAAKVAKDVAAGAVLIAAVAALIVGYVLFYDRLFG